MNKKTIKIIDLGYDGLEKIEWKHEHKIHINDNVLVKNCQRCELFAINSGIDMGENENENR